ncbi:MAG TPA: acetylxylan esterase [Rugosimonospora sp.]
MQFDLTVDELYKFRSPATEPEDFDEFWATTLAKAAEHPLGARFTPVPTRLSTIEVYDVVFGGYGGQPIAAWLMIPAGAAGRLPAIVEYQGYTGGRGMPHESLFWSAAGYAHLMVDCRGQVGADTPDLGGSGAPQSSGLVTRGIDDPRTYYYRRVFTDAVRAVDAVRCFERVDADRVLAVGGSQGGGIALAVAGLRADLAGLISDAPFLCDIMRSVTMTDDAPYSEIREYLRVKRDRVDAVRRTVGYHDGVHFAARGSAPAMFSVGLMDSVCPPSSVFAAHNAYPAAKRMKTWPFNGHENGLGYLRELHLEFAAEVTGAVNAGPDAVDVGPGPAVATSHAGAHEAVVR